MVLKYNGLNILKYESHFEKRRMVVQDSRKGEKINEPKPKNKKISPYPYSLYRRVYSKIPEHLQYRVTRISM